ncbi:flagellar hook-associated protein FlgL [Paraburkholderia acidipaludis]|uniref:flagellar hook-associated protein FlgL n=1 Tax=Paraburkholderia acidipaludis TaxID=660537 RepID=UPI000489825F|nr:flagellar hook-associated protein FlgL [Paraburkholderia acidipaludis]
MRIATSELYTSSLMNMENQQAQLLQIEQEVSSGQAITSPAEDPVGAAQAVQLSATSATLSQYTANQSTALSSLQTEGSALTSITTTLQSANSAMQSAMSGTMNNADLSALAQQLEGYRSELMSYANTTDGSGNAIFSGFQSTSSVFTNNASGVGVTYNGDAGQRMIQVSGSSQIAVADPGSSVFMSVPSVGSAAVPAGDASNSGTGTISAVTVTNASASTNNDNYSIAFSTDPTTGALAYTVTDSTAGTSVGPTDYTAGSAIPLGSGMNVTISGTPAVGDSFSVQPGTSSAYSDVFATLDNVIAALNTPSQNNTSASANLDNALTTGMTALSNSLSNVTTIQASVGGREQEVEALQTVTSTNSLQVSTNLSNLTSTDMTSAITQYTEVENALTASQKTFAATQSLSLFNYINP